MPNKPAKICPTCKARHRESGSHCAEHRGHASTKFANISQHELSGFYHTTQWRHARKQYLARFPICVACRSMGIATPGTVVDHIVPIRKGGALTDPDNLQSLCASCHNSKSAREKWHQNKLTKQPTLCYFAYKPCFTSHRLYLRYTTFTQRYLDGKPTQA